MPPTRSWELWSLSFAGDCGSPTPVIGAILEQSPQLCSRAFLGGDGGESRPALLDLLATAARADDAFLLMLGHRQKL